MAQDKLMTDEFIYQACRDASKMRSGFISAGHISSMTGLSRSRVFQGLRRLVAAKLLHQMYKTGPYYMGPTPSSATPSAPRGGEGSGAGSEGV
jgi:hypothetical protein